jgi:hypothetical protein
MATRYATMANVANKGDFQGENVILTSYSSNTTLSVGDIVIACRLPSGVQVTEVVMYPGAAGPNGVYQVGTSASVEQFLTSATMSTALAVKASKASSIGYVFSASDAAVVQYENVVVTPRSGVTAGRWFDLVVKYVNRGMNT